MLYTVGVTGPDPWRQTPSLRFRGQLRGEQCPWGVRVRQGRAVAAAGASVTPQGAQGRGGTLETFQTQVRDQDCLAPHAEHLRCGLSLGRCRTATEGGS